MQGQAIRRHMVLYANCQKIKRIKFMKAQSIQIFHASMDASQPLTCFLCAKAACLQSLALHCPAYAQEMPGSLLRPNFARQAVADF